jgi:hypothetical protein
MDRDEKTFHVIDSLQQGIKAVADLAARGVLIHLAITAYSFTFTFGKPAHARIGVFLANIIVTILAAAGVLIVGKTLNRKRKQLISLYADIDVDIGSDASKASSLSLITFTYVMFCVILIVLWSVGIWLPVPKVAG